MKHLKKYKVFESNEDNQLIRDIFQEIIDEHNLEFKEDIYNISNRRDGMYYSINFKNAGESGEIISSCRILICEFFNGRISNKRIMLEPGNKYKPAQKGFLFVSKLDIIYQDLEIFKKRIESIGFEVSLKKVYTSTNRRAEDCLIEIKIYTK